MSPTRGRWGVWGPVAVAVMAAMWAAASSGSELAPHLVGGEVYSETYTVVLELDHGRYAQFQQAVSNIGPGDQHGLCRLLVVDGDGSVFHRETILSRHEWALEGGDRLRFGTCFMAVEAGRVALRAEVDGGLLEAEMSEPLEPVQPPDHTILAGRRFFRHRILQRWSRVSGRLTVGDGEAVELSGHGAVHHFWVTALPRRLARSWLRVYGLSGGGAFWALTRVPPKGGGAVGSVWPPDLAQPIALGDLTTEGGDRPTAWLVEADGRRWRLEVERELFRHAPVEAVGWVGYLVRPFLGNPVTYTYRVRLTGPGVPSGATAIVEHTVDE